MPELPAPARLATAARPPRQAAVPPAAILGVVAASCAMAAIALMGANPGDPVSPASIAVTVPAVAAATILAVRTPVAAVAVTLLTIAFSGTLATNYDVPVEGFNWVLLAGLLTATVAGHLMTARTRRVVIWPSMVAVSLFVLYNAFQIPFADSVEIGARAFMAGPAYILMVPALAFAPWSIETRWRIAMALIAVAVLAGGYALYQLIVGPSEAEGGINRLSAGVGGELTLFGSLPNRVELGSWCAVIVPAMLTFVLAAHGAWRGLAAAALALSVAALLGSQVRTALVAAVAGVLLVLVLFQLSRSFGLGRLGLTLIASAGLILSGAVGYAATIAGSPQKEERFSHILDPGADFSFQRRLTKWEQALAEINSEPLGQGLGSAGSIQRQHARFRRFDNLFVDNSYLEVGLQLGYPGVAWLVLSVVMLLLALAGAAVQSTDARRSALAIAAAAGLGAWLVNMLTGGTYESWGAVTLWLLAGLAAGCFAWLPDRNQDDDAGSVPDPP